MRQGGGGRDVRKKSREMSGNGWEREEIEGKERGGLMEEKKMLDFAIITSEI